MSAAPGPTGTRRPLGANYWKLFGSSAAANLGDGLMTVAVVWLASSLTRDAMVIALVGLASRLPWLLFALPAGVITDRVDRRLLVGWMDAVRVVLVTGFGAVVLLQRDALISPEELAAGTPPPDAAPLLLTALCVVALLIGFAEVLRDNAAQTLMPALVDKRDLEKANGRLWGAEVTMNSLVGPPLGGVLIAIALAVPFLVNAGLLAVSAALVFSLAGSFAPSGGTGRGRIDWRAEIGEGFRWLWGHDLLRALAILLGALNLLSSLMLGATVLFVQEVLGVYQGWLYGLVMTGFAAGAVVGSVSGDRLTARLGPSAALLTAIVGMGVGTLVMGLVSHAIPFWLAGLVGGFLVVLWNVITVSLRQRLIPDHLLGRVNSVYRFFGWGTIAIGTALGGALVTAAEPWLGREWALRLPFVVSGVLSIALVAYALPRLRADRIAAAEAAAEGSASA